MRTARYHATSLVELLEEEVMATMDELKQALGTRVDMTVFRKLREIPYVTSYSDRGRYYALQGSARFDDRGLWTHAGVHFSRFGSLVDTVEHFVVESSAGYFASELAEELQVEVKEPLLTLLRAGRVSREQVEGLFLYCAPTQRRKRQQTLARRTVYIHEPFGSVAAAGGSTPDEVKAAIILFLSLLDEKQRRLFAGLESLRLGRGGDRRIAEWTGLDVHTVAKGRRELLAADFEVDRVRKPGGGRKAVEKKRRS